MEAMLDFVRSISCLVSTERPSISKTEAKRSRPTEFNQSVKSKQEDRTDDEIDNGY